jgi:hypothetical protein
MAGIGGSVGAMSSAGTGPELARSKGTSPSSGDLDMDTSDRKNESTDARIERAKDKALGAHDDHPSAGDGVGEAVGGIGGVLAGAAIGSLGGPVGTLIGGIAGALGGWWSGRAVAEATGALSRDDDEYYRKIWEGTLNRPADRSFEDVRPAYYLGHVAAHNPDYASKEWNEVQQDLQRGWNEEQTRRYGAWSTVSGYASEGFNRARSTLDNASHRAAKASAGTFDRAPTNAEIRAEDRDR